MRGWSIGGRRVGIGFGTGGREKGRGLVPE